MYLWEKLVIRERIFILLRKYIIHSYEILFHNYPIIVSWFLLYIITMLREEYGYRVNWTGGWGDRNQTDHCMMFFPINSHHYIRYFEQGVEETGTYPSWYSVRLAITVARVRSGTGKSLMKNLRGRIYIRLNRQSCKWINT